MGLISIRNLRCGSVASRLPASFTTTVLLVPWTLQLPQGFVVSQLVVPWLRSVRSEPTLSP